MKFSESIQISAPSTRVWQVLSDPTMMELWNPKCIRCETPNDRRVELGFEFAARFRLREKESQGRARISQFEKPHRIAFSYAMDESKPMSRATERFELSEAEKQTTRILHTVEIDDSEIPFWARCLIGFITRFGKRKGDSFSSLETLKVLIEEEMDSQNSVARSVSPRSR